jgi:hypothetical protein
MKLLKAIVAVLVLVAAAVAVQRWCVLPWQCATVVKRVRERSERLRATNDYRTRTIARRNLELLGPCDVCCRNNVDYLMVKGGNQFALEDYAGALATNQHALTVDRRPEIYLDIGLAQLNLGRTAEATETLMAGSRFNFAIIDEVPDPVKYIIYERMIAERKALNAKLAK